MEKEIACYDVDGTLASGMLFVPLIESEFKQGILSAETHADITALLGQYKAGNIDYESAVQLLLTAHATGLEGQSITTVEAHAEQFVQRSEALFRTFGKQVIALLRTDYQQVLVTAEPQYLAAAVAHYFDVDDTLSTQYETVGGRFTGVITTSLADRQAKHQALASYDVAYAFGDSAGDIEMLRRAAHAYCIAPTDDLKTVAEEAGWYIYETNDAAQLVDDVRLTLAARSGPSLP